PSRRRTQRYSSLPDSASTVTMANAELECSEGNDAPPLFSHSLGSLVWYGCSRRTVIFSNSVVTLLRPAASSIDQASRCPELLSVNPAHTQVAPSTATAGSASCRSYASEPTVGPSVLMKWVRTWES